MPAASLAVPIAIFVIVAGGDWFRRGRLRIDLGVWVKVEHLGSLEGVVLEVWELHVVTEYGMHNLTNNIDGL